MHLLSLLLFSVASLSVGVHFGVDQVRPMNGNLCFGDGVDKGGSRIAPFESGWSRSPSVCQTWLLDREVWDRNADLAAAVLGLQSSTCIFVVFRPKTCEAPTGKLRGADL